MYILNDNIHGRQDVLLNHRKIFDTSQYIATTKLFSVNINPIIYMLKTETIFKNILNRVLLHIKSVEQLKSIISIISNVHTDTIEQLEQVNKGKWILNDDDRLIFKEYIQIDDIYDFEPFIYHVKSNNHLLDFKQMNDELTGQRTDGRDNTGDWFAVIIHLNNFGQHIILDGKKELQIDGNIGKIVVIDNLTKIKYNEKHLKINDIVIWCCKK
jgi:hypothetical protein